MKEKRAKIITLVGICIILIATICGVFYIKGQDKKKVAKKSETTTATTQTTTKVAKVTTEVKKKATKKTTTTEEKKNATTAIKKKDKYQTNPTPAGKPKPVEPQDTKVDTKKSYTCTVEIECKTVLGQMENLKEGKSAIVPSDGVILKSYKVTFSKGQNAYDVLLKATKENKIPFESSNVPGYNSRYIEGVGNLYEKDCGELSGWMYQVNGWFPNYGCSRYEVKNGDKIIWRYTCDLGDDIGGNNG